LTLVHYNVVANDGGTRILFQVIELKI